MWWEAFFHFLTKEVTHMFVYHFTLNETIKTDQVLRRSIAAKDVEEALMMLQEEYPWAYVISCIKVQISQK